MAHKDIAKDWFASIDANTLDKNASMLADNHQFFNPMTPAPANKEEHIGILKMMTSGLQGKHILDLVLTEGDHVAVKGRWVGTHAGDFNGIPATGKPVEFTWVDILQIENGKIAREHMEMNPMAIMMQISG
jgi:ketosteroid isomerase-like protein